MKIVLKANTDVELIRWELPSDVEVGDTVTVALPPQIELIYRDARGGVHPFATTPVSGPGVVHHGQCNARCGPEGHWMEASGPHGEPFSHQG